MSTNEPNISKNSDDAYNASMPPQNPYDTHQGAQYQSQQHDNLNHPNSNYQHSPRTQNGGIANGTWSMIMFGGTILFSFIFPIFTFIFPIFIFPIFIFPIVCIGTAIGGIIFGHLGWRDHKEVLARVGFWINLSSIVLGFLLFLLVIFLLAIFDASFSSNVSHVLLI